MAETDDGSGAFVRATLRPTAKIFPTSDPAKALALHEEAHRFCFIAKSVNFPVDLDPTVTVAGP